MAIGLSTGSFEAKISRHSANLILVVTFYVFLKRHFKKNVKSHVFLKYEKTSNTYSRTLATTRMTSLRYLGSNCRGCSSSHGVGDAGAHTVFRRTRRWRWGLVLRGHRLWRAGSHGCWRAHRWRGHWNRWIPVDMTFT